MTVEKPDEAVATVRSYALPDWGSLDTVWQRAQPFVLWKIGEQSLLYHWLDAAVDAGVERVILYAADRPAEVRRAMVAATLWPLQWELRAVPDPSREAVDETIDRLPGMPPGEAPDGGFGLIRYWHSLEQEWLARFAKEAADYPIDLGVGRGCEIHPGARLLPPYWIGDYVSIGPRCTIGPGSVVGDGALIAAGAQIERAHVAEGTYLGPETELREAVLEGATLLNLKHGARVERLEDFIAGDAQPSPTPQRPPLSERWIAFRLWWHWRHARAHETAGGKGGAGFFAALRRPLLREVWRGRMRLFGPLPRPESEWRNLPEEWRALIRAAAPGALGYADVMGTTTGTFEEALHTMYFLTDASGQVRRLCERWARNLLREAPPQIPSS